MDGQSSDRPRDEKGRFTTADAEMDNSADAGDEADEADQDQDQDQDQQPDEVVCTKEIDLGDGSGKQVFSKLAENEPNPKIKKQLLDAAGSYSISAKLPLVGPVAANLCRACCLWSSGPIEARL